jgi:hypothetical protein
MTPTTLGFGPVAEGVTVSNAITITNTGSATATITSVTPPNAPFSMTGAPAANSTIAPGASKQVTVRFSPVAEGAFTGTVTVASDGGTVSTALTGTGAHPAFVTITPLSNPLGDVTVGTTAIAQFTLTNTGGVPATISVSKPPTGGIFQAQTNLPEGTQIPAGASITKRVAFTPTSTGFQSAVWQITASDGQGPRNVSFSGTGVTGSVAIPNVGGAGWTLRGTAVPSTGGVTLTAATDENAAGSVFYSTPVSTSNFSASFDAKLSGGGQLEGADGLTLTFANPNSPTLLGGQGGGLGFTGITGVAVALDTYQNSVNPSANFVGIGTGALDGDNNLINWLVTNSSPSLPNLRAATVHVDITAKNGVLTMKLNGVQVLSQSVTLPPQALIGFTAGNGSVTDNHIVTNTVITSGAVTPPPPPPTSNGLYRTAIEANTAGLWLAATGGTNLGLGLMPGTSPSITALTGGGYQIAFQSNTGSLWSTGTAGTRNWGLGVKAGTSPSITALAGGGYQIAFQANTGVLWTAGTAGISNLQLGMKAGTNPAITNVPGGYQIAFQANTSALWSTGTAGTRNWGLGMNGTTSPSITGLAGGGYQIAFQANTGSLWTAGTAGIVNWNLGMYAGTNPAISR